MRNRWNIEKYPVIRWVCSVDNSAVAEVLRLGEESGVYRVLGNPALEYSRRNRGGFPPAPTTDHPFLSAVRRTTSRVSYLDRRGTLMEDDVEDLGVLLNDSRLLEQYRRAPLDISLLEPPEGLTLVIESCSDIWLPWCSGHYEEGAEPHDLADNRTLAARHTPRLNAFLAAISDIAARTGGLLRADRGTSEPGLLFQVVDHGVRLDIERPPGRVVGQDDEDPA